MFLFVLSVPLIQTAKAEDHARLAELYQRKDQDLLIVCAHDPTLLEQARATA